MRILLDQAEHALRNKGNNALLSAALERLRVFWPAATFEIVTLAPTLARLYFPACRPVSPDDLRPLPPRFRGLEPYLPPQVWRTLLEVREEVWHRRAAHADGRTAQFAAADLDTQQPGAEADGHDLAAIARFDLIVATGGGYLCDHDRDMAQSLFDRLEAAMRLGIPTVMVGQGVGPLTGPGLCARASQILPRVDLIGYRNHRLGQPLLEALGVAPDRMILTGDDAVEMAYRMRPAALGASIGVSLRIAAYTAVDEQQVEAIRSVLHRAAHSRHATLVAVPISSAHHESDITTIRHVLAGYPNVVVPLQKLGAPTAAIRQAGKCRLMVTGTYHGAIFALAQGIPVIGVAGSQEYFDKLSELSDAFGPGCQVIDLRDEHAGDRLAELIDLLWSTADKLRPELLQAASHQIAAQHIAYQRIFETVTSRIDSQSRVHVA